MLLQGVILLKKLEKDNRDYHKKIEEAKELIAKMEKNIEQNEIEQKNKVSEIHNKNETSVQIN